MPEIALYQPDIAPNAATIIRMATCFGLKVTIIEPAGFAWTDSSFRRAGLDYLDRASVDRSPSWQEGDLFVALGEMPAQAVAGGVAPALDVQGPQP